MPLRSSSERQKEQLEVAKLKRDLQYSPITQIFLDKWLPALVATIALFTVVPASNWAVWWFQKKTEFQLVTLQKQMETYSQVTALATEFKQTAALLNENKCSHSSVSGKGETWCERLVIKRFELEPKLVKALRDVQVYFPGLPADKVDDIRDVYNKYPDEPLHQKFLNEFTKEFDSLTKLMKAEIQTHLKTIS